MRRLEGEVHAMRDPDLVYRAERAATALERAWGRWRAMHGLGADPPPPVSSYVGYSVEEPWGQPRVIFGMEAAEAEKLADVLDGHDCFGPVHAELTGRSGWRRPPSADLPLPRNWSFDGLPPVPAQSPQPVSVLLEHTDRPAYPGGPGAGQTQSDAADRTAATQHPGERDAVKRAADGQADAETGQTAASGSSERGEAATTTAKRPRSGRPPAESASSGPSDAVAQPDDTGTARAERPPQGKAAIAAPEQSGPAEQSGSAEQPGPAEQSGPAEQPVLAEQSGPAEQPDVADLKQPDQQAQRQSQEPAAPAPAKPAGSRRTGPRSGGPGYRGPRYQGSPPRYQQGAAGDAARAPKPVSTDGDAAQHQAPPDKSKQGRGPKLARRSG